MLAGGLELGCFLDGPPHGGDQARLALDAVVLLVVDHWPLEDVRHLLAPLLDLLPLQAARVEGRVRVVVSGETRQRSWRRQLDPASNLNTCPKPVAVVQTDDWDAVLRRDRILEAHPIRVKHVRVEDGHHHGRLCDAPAQPAKTRDSNVRPSVSRRAIAMVEAPRRLLRVGIPRALHMASEISVRLERSKKTFCSNEGSNTGRERQQWDDEWGTTVHSGGIELGT